MFSTLDRTLNIEVPDISTLDVKERSHAFFASPVDIHNQRMAVAFESAFEGNAIATAYRFGHLEVAHHNGIPGSRAIVCRNFFYETKPVVVVAQNHIIPFVYGVGLCTIDRRGKV